MVGLLSGISMKHVDICALHELDDLNINILCLKSVFFLIQQSSTAYSRWILANNLNVNRNMMIAWGSGRNGMDWRVWSFFSTTITGCVEQHFKYDIWDIFAQPFTTRISNHARLIDALETVFLQLYHASCSRNNLYTTAVHASELWIAGDTIIRITFQK